MKILINNIIKRNFTKQNLMKTAVIVSISFVGLGFVSCEKDFLNVVPDNVATIDQAFKLRNEAEKYLFTCYSYMPRNGNVVYNTAMLAGDELWIPPQDRAINSNSFDIARGLQRITDTYVDAWEGHYQGAGPNDNYPLFDGIRHCNIFIENLEDENSVPDITMAERQRWIAEAKFLKAYYHFCLMRMYGPIPIMDKAIPVDAPEDELFVSRKPIDEVVDYIVQLLDEANEKLPPIIPDPANELGRATKSIALGLKSQVLLTAASPLYNGNSDYAGFVNKEGENFFNQNYEEDKWRKAADAAKAAIEQAESSGHSLYHFNSSAFNISDTTKLKLTIRQALMDRGNPEVIWPNTLSRTYDIQEQSMMPLLQDQPDNTARKYLSPPLEIAKMFYSKNGVPIEEDKTLNFSNIDELRTASEEERFNIAEGYETARLNFDREPRFYADLGFDGAIVYLENSTSNDTKWHIEAKYQDYSGSNDVFNFNVTGYYLKKLVDYHHSYSSGSGSYYKEYAWPELRLAQLYLNYAEALNEAEGPTPEVLAYIDRIRERAGLNGVAESWQNFSVNPNEYTTKEGMRKIIHHERKIELAFEGKRYWDLKRWKTAVEELNEPIQGWNVYGKTNASYYQITTLFQQRFVSPRDYFWPLNQTTLRQNPNLVQNPGW